MTDLRSHLLQFVPENLSFIGNFRYAQWQLVNMSRWSRVCKCHSPLNSCEISFWFCILEKCHQIEC